MKNLNLGSIFDLQMIENKEFSSSIKDSGYPITKLQKELNRNLTINPTQTKMVIKDDQIDIQIIFINPDDVSIGGIQYFDTLQIQIKDS